MQPDERWPGRKGQAGVAQRIISMMPPHTTYIEPFLGKSPIIRAKRPAAVTIGIDRDPAIVRWWSELPSSGVTVIHGDALRILSSNPAMRDPTALLYVDPPYLLSTRTRLLYDFELTSEVEHRRLLKMLLSATCMVMISGYASPLYATMLEQWRVISFRSMTRGGVRMECVWLNFPEPARLHDPRFYGASYRERERIKRRRQRWVKRLMQMSPGERQLIAEALSAANAATGDNARSFHLVSPSRLPVPDRPTSPSSKLAVRSASSLTTMGPVRTTPPARRTP